MGAKDEIESPRRQSGAKPNASVNLEQARTIVKLSLSMVTKILGQLDICSDSSIVIAAELSNDILHAEGSPVSSRKGLQVTRNVFHLPNLSYRMDCREVLTQKDVCFIAFDRRIASVLGPLKMSNV